MSKTLLIIGGSVAGTAVVAGGAATGIVISQQNGTSESTTSVLANIKAQIETKNTLSKDVSATSIYPDGKGTVLNADQLAALGLDSTFEGYTVSVTVDAITETTVTFEVALDKTGETQQTVKVSLLGFKAASTDKTNEAFDALVTSVDGKVFEVSDKTEYVQAIVKNLEGKDLAEQLALVLSKNETLNGEKSAFDTYAKALTSQQSITSAGTLLAVSVTLVDGTTEKVVTFSLNGFVNGETALRTKAAAVAGDYVVVESVSTSEFVKNATVETLASLVTGLSEKLASNGVTLVSVTADSVLPTATAVVFKVRLALTTTDLQAETTISVTGLKAETEIEQEQAQAELNGVIAAVKDQTYTVNNTTTSVNEFVTEASAWTIASLINASFKEALGNAEVSEIKGSVQNSSFS